MLYLSTAKGKVVGPELPPFELPHRWTYDTLYRCIKDQIARRTAVETNSDVIIDQLYYRKNRGETVILLNSDQDVTSMLQEYPLVLRRSGIKKSKMYLAVDYRTKQGEKYI